MMHHAICPNCGTKSLWTMTGYFCFSATCQGKRVYSFQELIEGLDLLEHASMYIDTQFSTSLPRQQAQDHFDTRATLLKIRLLAINDAEKAFPEHA